MEYRIMHNDPNSDTDGTGLKGYMTATYAKLMEMFGYPCQGDGYKIDAKWEIKFEDDTVATIYNWKNGKNYNGADGIPREEITEWHIGGYDDKSIKNMNLVMPDSNVHCYQDHDYGF